MNTLKATLLIGLLAAPAAALAAPAVTYSGTLRGPGGGVVAAGDYEMAFRLYDAASEG